MRGWIIERLLKSKNPKELDEEISEIDMPFRELIKSIRSKLPDLIAQAWSDLLDFLEITDEAIQEILKEYDCANTPTVMRAKYSILKAYSYESPLYKAINRANEYQDKKAI